MSAIPAGALFFPYYFEGVTPGAVRIGSPFLLSLFLFLTIAAPDGAAAQTPGEAEVRQIVTFTFLPGKYGEVMEIYREAAIPLYRKNASMLSVRGFREVESPVALDLMLVSAFRGMEGMDSANTALRTLASEAETSIGALYGAISKLTSGHTDQFIEMVPALGAGDPSARRLTAFVWYRILPDQRAEFERVLKDELVPWEESNGIDASTGRFLVSDGWDYLRTVGFDSLGEFQAYWTDGAGAGHHRLGTLTTKRREVIVSSIQELSVR